MPVTSDHKVFEERYHAPYEMLHRHLLGVPRLVEADAAQGLPDLSQEPAPRQGWIYFNVGVWPVGKKEDKNKGVGRVNVEEGRAFVFVRGRFVSDPLPELVIEYAGFGAKTTLKAVMDIHISLIDTLKYDALKESIPDFETGPRKKTQKTKHHQPVYWKGATGQGFRQDFREAALLEMARKMYDNTVQGAPTLCE
jgi:hypothetical protein